MTCTNCGQILNPGAAFCMKCGTRAATLGNIKINEASRVCEGCGAALTSGIAICEMCGRDNSKPLISTANGQINIDTRNLDRVKNAAISNLDTKSLSSAQQEVIKSYPRAGGGARAAACLIDNLIYLVLAGISAGLLAVVYALWVGWAKGQGMQSIGYRAMGLYLVRENDRKFIGGAAGIGREMLHILDILSLGIGYIVGMATGKCFADRVMHTIVVRRPS